MDIQFKKIVDSEEKTRICRKVLEDLPMWFGLPESTNEYCEKVKEYEFVVICNAEEKIGFASIRENSEYVSELFVLGIMEKYHRKGIGKLLMEYLYKELKKKKIQYLEVKTLDESRESEEYKMTRLFYKKMGFIPFDVLENEWGKENPCLIMLKDLG
ncbi:MAG: GNAT family N-acetyltransferase [Sphaerochaetaceae bacterium]